MTSCGILCLVSALPGLSDHRHTLCMHHCGPKITKCVQTQCLELGRLTAEVRCIPNWIPWLRDEIKYWHTHTHWHSNYYKMQKNGVQDQFSVWVPAEMVSIMSLLRPKCSAGIRSAEERHPAWAHRCTLCFWGHHYWWMPRQRMIYHDNSWYVIYDTVRTTTIYMDAKRC